MGGVGEEIGIGRCEGRRGRVRLVESCLENWNRIQVGRVSSAAAGAGTAEGQLAAARSVGSITQEVEAEQGVIVKNSVGGANDGLAISLGIPSEADARLEIVFVGLDAFLQSQRAIGRKSETLRGPAFR